MPVTGIGSSAAADSVAALVSSLNTASAATTAAATATTLAGNSATAASQYDAVVHPSASIGYSTVTAALAAIPTGGRILVKSSTTETLSITKRCTIEWVGGAQLINSGATDTITTGVAENANGAVADVKLINPWLTNTLTDTVLGTGLALAASGDTVTSAAHGLVAGKQVQLANVTATGVSAAVTYFVVSPTTNTFKLSLTYGGSVVDITVDGTADVTVLGRNAAAGFNLHGALRWRIENAKVEYHAKGVYFSATPYPSGQGSHNTFRSLFISNCGVGVHNGGTANINNLYDLYTYNCSKHLWHESGLNLNIFGHRAENLAGGTEEMIALEAAGTFLYGLHAEGQGANPVLRLGSACRAVVEGDIYITTGVRYLITSGARYKVHLKGAYDLADPAARGQQVVSATMTDSISTTSTYTLMAMPTNAMLTRVEVYNNGFATINSGVDYWTFKLEHYNGNVKVEDIPGATFTATSQIGLGAINLVPTGLYDMTQNRLVRLTVTKTGSPGALTRPTAMVYFVRGWSTA